MPTVKESMLETLKDDPKRYSELMNSLQKPDKTIYVNLKELQDIGLVKKNIETGEYYLTQIGKERLNAVELALQPSVEKKVEISVAKTLLRETLSYLVRLGFDIRQINDIIQKQLGKDPPINKLTIARMNQFNHAAAIEISAIEIEKYMLAVIVSLSDGREPIKKIREEEENVRNEWKRQQVGIGRWNIEVVYPDYLRQLDELRPAYDRLREIFGSNEHFESLIKATEYHLDKLLKESKELEVGIKEEYPLLKRHLEKAESSKKQDSSQKTQESMMVENFSKHSDIHV